MSEQMSEMVALPTRRSLRNASKPKLTVIGVIGELVITAGVVILLFVGWQTWFNDLVVGSAQQVAGTEFSEQWIATNTDSNTEVAPEEEPPESRPEPLASTDDPPILNLGESDVAFAVLIVPRFGENFSRTVSQGVGSEVINSSKSGVGHYTGTSAPGELGNFAVAAHRTTYGRSFHDIDKLLTGDHIYLETKDGWYRYVYRNSEYVHPSGVGVLAPLPQFTAAKPSERILTMTSCNPRFSAAERIIAYAVMDAFFPRAGGAPNEVFSPTTAEVG